MTVTARRREDELARVRGAQHTAAFRTARQRLLHSQAGTVNDIDGTVTCVRYEHAARGWMDVAMVKPAPGVSRQRDAPPQCERHAELTCVRHQAYSASYTGSSAASCSWSSA